MNIFSNLNWNTHVNRANTSLEFIRRNVKTKSPKIREMAYKILVRPQLEYASEVWDPHTKEQTHKMEMVQRRAARWTKKDWNRTTSVISLLQLDWQTLENGAIREWSRVNVLPEFLGNLDVLDYEPVITSRQKAE